MKTAKTVMCYFGSSFMIDVELTPKQLEKICKGGQDNDQAIKNAMRSKLVKSQFAYWEEMKDKIARELDDTGADFDTSDHKENISRLIWMAAWNYIEDQKECNQ